MVRVTVEIHPKCRVIVEVTTTTTTTTTTAAAAAAAAAAFPFFHHIFGEVNWVRDFFAEVLELLHTHLRLPLKRAPLLRG
jgi:hypothetical protein